MKAREVVILIMMGFVVIMYAAYITDNINNENLLKRQQQCFADTKNPECYGLGGK